MGGAVVLVADVVAEPQAEALTASSATAASFHMAAIYVQPWSDHRHPSDDCCDCPLAGAVGAGDPLAPDRASIGIQPPDRTTI